MSSGATNESLNCWMVLEKMPKEQDGFFSCHSSNIVVGTESFLPGQMLRVKYDDKPTFLAELVVLCGKFNNLTRLLIFNFNNTLKIGILDTKRQSILKASQLNIILRTTNSIEKITQLRRSTLNGNNTKLDTILNNETPENRNIFDMVVTNKEVLHEEHNCIRTEFSDNKMLMLNIVKQQRESDAIHSQPITNDFDNSGNSSNINSNVTEMMCDADDDDLSNQFNDNLNITKKSTKGLYTKKGKKSLLKINKSSKVLKKSKCKKVIIIPEVISDAERILRIHIAKALSNLNMVTDTKVLLGSNGTAATLDFIHSVDWIHPIIATRKLLFHLFPREILATHSLTGKTSPAAIGKRETTKGQLNKRVVEDIIEFMKFICATPTKIVRTTITTKCADENKMLRLRNERDGFPMNYILPMDEVYKRFRLHGNNLGSLLKETNKNNNSTITDHVDIASSPRQRTISNKEN